MKISDPCDLDGIWKISASVDVQIKPIGGFEWFSRRNSPLIQNPSLQGKQTIYTMQNLHNIHISNLSIFKLCGSDIDVNIKIEIINKLRSQNHGTEAEIQLPLKRSSRFQRLFPNPSWLV